MSRLTILMGRSSSGKSCRRRGQANRHEVASGAEGDLGEASLDGAEPPLDRRLQGLASLGQGNGTPEPFEKQASQMTL